MYISGTQARSQSGTYTDARANHVTGKVYENLLGMLAANLITQKRADQIREDLLFFQKKQVLDYFEFQFFNSDGTKIGGLHYTLESNGQIYTDEESGGIDFWNLPSNTKVVFFVVPDNESANIDEYREYTKNWGTGSSLEGEETHLKSYSKDGYGFKQSRIGEW